MNLVEDAEHDEFSEDAEHDEFRKTINLDEKLEIDCLAEMEKSIVEIHKVTLEMLSCLEMSNCRDGAW